MEADAEALALYLRLEGERRRRRQAVALVAAAVAAAALALPPVRGVLADMLDVFRVERVRIVPVSEAALAALQSLGQSVGRQAGQALAGLGLAETEGGEVSGPLAAEEAAARLPFAPPLLRETPADLGGPEVRVRDAAAVRLTLDTDAANAVLAAAGAAARLPDSLDGTTVVLRLGPAALISYPRGDGVPGLFVLRTPAPRWEAPAGADLDALRVALLSIPALPPDLRAELAALGDWRRVLPVPSPRGTVREVTVQGVPGAYLPGGGVAAEATPKPGRRAWHEGDGQDGTGHPEGAGTLLWLRDGLLTAVTGPGNLSDLLRVASLLP